MGQANAIPSTYRAVQLARVDWLEFRRQHGTEIKCQHEAATVYYRATVLDAARVVVEFWKERTGAEV